MTSLTVVVFILPTWVAPLAYTSNLMSSNVGWSRVSASLSLLFYPGGGLGDSIVSLPVLYAIHEFFDGWADIDIVTGQNIEALRELYYGIPFVGDIVPCPPGAESVLAESYDAMVVANEQVVLQVKDKAQAYISDFVACVESGWKRRDAFGLANRVHNLLNNQLANHAVLLGLDRRSLPLYSMGMPNYHETMPAMQLHPGALDVLERHGLVAGQYITLQDGWDANFPLKTLDTRPTKVWPAAAWAALVVEIRARHPNMKIVQLGSAKTGGDIAGVDLNLRGKASLRDALALLKFAALHVDTEGGLVHMARGLHTRCVVLFGPTNAKFFGYARNKNLVPPCHNCWWMIQDWMSECLRGLDVPECMTHHTPAAVANAVSEILAENPAPRAAARYGAVPLPSSPGTIGVANNAALAMQFSAAGHAIIHFDLLQQKNIQRPLDGMAYRQFVARPSNLPVENQILDQLHFTADANANEFAGELLEALGVMKVGGQAVIHITAAARDATAAAFAKANLPPPAGEPAETIILARTA